MKGGPKTPSKTGNFPEVNVGASIPPKPAHQGFTKQSGDKAYKSGCAVGTVKNK